MPYKNEHAARVRNPEDFEENPWVRKNIAHGIDIILGHLKGEKTFTIQAYRFDKTVFTVAEAKDWLKRHKINYILFEPAEGSKSLVDLFFEKLKL